LVIKIHIIYIAVIKIYCVYFYHFIFFCIPSPKFNLAHYLPLLITLNGSSSTASDLLGFTVQNDVFVSCAVYGCPSLIALIHSGFVPCAYMSPDLIPTISYIIPTPLLS